MLGDGLMRWVWKRFGGHGDEGHQIVVVPLTRFSLKNGHTDKAVEHQPARRPRKGGAGPLAPIRPPAAVLVEMSRNDVPRACWPHLSQGRQDFIGYTKEIVVPSAFTS